MRLGCGVPTNFMPGVNNAAQRVRGKTITQAFVGLMTKFITTHITETGNTVTTQIISIVTKFTTPNNICSIYFKQH